MPLTNSSWRRGTFARLLVVVSVLVTGVVAVPTPPAEAQNLQTAILWARDSGEIWKYKQSIAGDDTGSATAADPAFDDSSWTDVTAGWYAIVGPGNSNHFRKSFNMNDLLSALDPPVSFSQVVGIEVGLEYDDAAVLYLNGTEVYRSIRGNVDPTYTYPVGADLPYNLNIPHGGWEQYVVNIPDPAMTNTCQFPDAACSTSPYGGPHPPAIPVNLLNPGDNNWGVTVWNNSQGGSGDGRMDLIFKVVYDSSIAGPAVEINEVVASNNGSYQVQLDNDAELETPDWIELKNTNTSQAVDISGWTISDATATWTFPAGTVIAAGGYLMLAANDGDDPTTSPMQTNFRLSSTGDELTLLTQSGVIADEYAWTDMFTDNSIGRPLDDSSLNPTYLASTTPASVNSGPLTQAPPILRYFRDRMYNPGEPVTLSINAFDPDGDALSYNVAPRPLGVGLNVNDGLLTGFYNALGNMTSTITVVDNDGDTDSQTFSWFRVPAPVGPSSPLVLNEYNAVPSTGELAAGSVVGNGGDWFEFLVVDDNLDLRGWTIEFRQRDANTGELRTQTFATFGDHPELGAIPSGTIITISEDNPDDLSFDAVNDWSINLLMDNLANGPFFEPAEVGDTFNSTRRDQTVLIKNAAGQVVTPLSGETDGWDALNGGVGAGEVMNLCRDMQQGMTIAPTADYRDNGVMSTFGEPNVCIYPDPLNPQVLINDPQDLAPLRASASLGAGSGDVNCDLVVNIVDALRVAQLQVGVMTDTGPCLLDQGGPGHEAAAVAGDVNADGATTVLDALMIAQCVAGIALPVCASF